MSAKGFRIGPKDQLHRTWAMSFRQCEYWVDSSVARLLQTFLCQEACGLVRRSGDFRVASLQISADFRWLPLPSPDFRGLPQTSAGFRKFPWASTDLRGLPQASANFRGLPQTSVASLEVIKPMTLPAERIHSDINLSAI